MPAAAGLHMQDLSGGEFVCSVSTRLFEPGSIQRFPAQIDWFIVAGRVVGLMTMIRKWVGDAVFFSRYLFVFHLFVF